MLLQRSGKDGRVWGGWFPGNSQWQWGCADSGWERDVEVHKGWDLCLCGGGAGCGGGVGGGDGVDGSDGGDRGGCVDGSGGNSGVGDGGESGVCRKNRGGGSVVHRSVGGGLCRSGWHVGVGCVFCGWGGGGSGAGGGVCCEAVSVVCELEGILFALF